MEYIVQAKENSSTFGKGKEVGILNRGDLLIITCDPQDKWNIAGGNKDGECNALGLANNPAKVDGQTFNLGALVASIKVDKFDEKAYHFQVGTLLEMTILEDHTTVNLYCWDVNKSDNNGGISVNVMRMKAN